jgi:sigma-B regulation protein RsbU (phosphoserine phosphatase)
MAAQFLPVLSDATTVDVCRILLAEDENRSRQLLTRYLKSWGFSVVAASDGLEAASILDREDAPQLALIDWMMPGMEGTEVCQRVRQQADKPYTYLVLLTAKADKEAVAVGLEAGADDYVTKPCDLTELHARLKVGQRVLSLERMLARQVLALQESLDQVRQLKEMLPICAWCKRVRDDEHYWHNIEEYLHEHAGTDFTHGICPHCLEVARAGLPILPTRAPVK